MISLALTLLHLVWPYLPELTVALRFASALIGFVLVCTTVVRRLRRRRRRLPPGRNGGLRN
ncbi:MAG: hypothetical protein ABW000_25325 [Actinoplanes sp.]